MITFSAPASLWLFAIAYFKEANRAGVKSSQKFMPAVDWSTWIILDEITKQALSNERPQSFLAKVR